MEPFEGAIRDAIQREQMVAFDYPPSDAKFGTTPRTFSPWQILGESVLGWDHGRDEIRRYRFDRMTQFHIPIDPDDDYVVPQ